MEMQRMFVYKVWSTRPQLDDLCYFACFQV